MVKPIFRASPSSDEQKLVGARLARNMAATRLAGSIDPFGPLARASSATQVPDAAAPCAARRPPSGSSGCRLRPASAGSAAQAEPPGEGVADRAVDVAAGPFPMLMSPASPPMPLPSMPRAESRAHPVSRRYRVHWTPPSAPARAPHEQRGCRGGYRRRPRRIVVEINVGATGNRAGRPPRLVDIQRHGQRAARNYTGRVRSSAGSAPRSCTRGRPYSAFPAAVTRSI